MNDEATPNAMRWLRAIEDRPAVKKVMATAPRRGMLPTKEAHDEAKKAKSA